MIQPIIDQVTEYTTDIEQYSDLLQSFLISAYDTMNRIISITEEVDATVDTAQKYFDACVWTSTLFYIVILAMLVG